MQTTVYNSILIRVAASFVVFAGTLTFAGSISGQDTDVTDTAPPPLRKISESEQKFLNAETNVKRRTQVALNLMSSRLTRAEDFFAKGQYAELYLELGAFHGLMDNTLLFLERSTRTESKALNDLKRFEIGLRTFSPRLEVIRRDLPAKYEYYVRGLLRYVREARTRAVEPLFGDSVIRKPNTLRPQ